MQRRTFCSALVGGILAPPLRGAAPDDTPVRQWVERARTLKSVEADFKQERYLRALNRPLVAPGRVWFRSDGALRWQLGDPPKTIALRPAAGSAIRVIEPEAKTVRSFTVEEAGSKGGALSLLDAGFPRSYESFESRFKLDRVERDEDGAWRITTHLRENALAVAVQRLVFIVESESSRVQGIEVWLRDGSRIASLFTNLKENAPLPDTLFDQNTDGYREVK
ncbi:MAG: LolA family protein [Verrucomicrobiales bacterium]